MLIGIAVGAGIGWYAWAQKQYYVATSDTALGPVVAVYQGPAQELFGLELSQLVETSEVEVANLPEFEQEQVGETIPARSLDGAREIVTRLADQADRCISREPALRMPGGTMSVAAASRAAFDRLATQPA